MIDRIKTLQDKPLSTYHQAVVSDFLRAYKKWGRLTPRQEAFFGSIEAEYGADAIRERERALHKLKSDEQYRNDVKTVCEYYKSTGYYRNTFERALQFLSTGDVKDAPDPKALDKMMNNKYAINILSSINAEPKYSVGELVQLRANFDFKNVKYTNRNDTSAEAFMIVEVDSCPINRPLSYCKTKGGSRWYKLLALGSTATIEVIERELKRPTKKTLGKK